MNSTLRNGALALGALLAFASLGEGAERPRRLVEPLSPTTLQRGNHTLNFQAPSTRGKWFLSLSATGRRARVRIKLNGATVVPDQPCAGLPRTLLVPITVQATNTLQVRVSGRPPAQVTLGVQGVVQERHLPPNTGVRVAKTRLLSKTLRIRSGWRGYGWAYEAWPVQSPTTQGLFVLEGVNGPGTQRPLSFGLARWNGSLALGLRARRETRRTRLEPQLNNVLSVFGKGRVGARARFRVIGYLVDEIAPTISFASPQAGATVQASTPVELAYADDQALDQDSLRVLLNGQDVTAAFTTTGSGATSTVGALPQNLLVPGTNQLEARVSDRACNTTTTTLSFQVGGGSPVFTPPPANLVIEQAGPTGTVVTYPLPAVTDDDDPNPSVVCSPASGSLFPAGVTTVTCTATDASGNATTATFTVTVRDTTAPTLAPSPNRVVEQSSPSGATVTYTAPAATDAVTPNPSVVCSPPSGSTFGPGVTTVTCTATDAAGNQSSSTFQVTVQDTTAPSITSQPDLVVEQTGPTGSVVSYVAPVASDAGTAVPTVVCSPASGTLFAPGTTQVTCTATDAAGNQASSTFQVTVQDTTAPSIAAQPNLAVEQTGPTGSVVNYVAPVSSDAVTASPTVVCSPASGTLFAPGTTQVTCTATDAAGNQASTIFEVTVQDTTAPSIATQPNLVIEQTGPTGSVVSYVAPVSSDAVTASPTVVCSPASGTLFVPGTTQVTCTATDAAGNQASTTFEVTVQDTTAPTLAAQPDLFVEQSTPAGSVVSYVAPVASDAVSSPSVVCSPASGTLFASGTTQVTCTATDAAGNQTSITFEVTVQDTTPPQLAPIADLILEQSSPQGTPLALVAPVTSDAADPNPTVTCSPAVGTLLPPGITSVTCTATDAAGNASSQTFQVTVQDTTPPSLAPSADLSVEQQGPAGSPVTFALPLASDVADPAPNVVCSPPSGTTFPAGQTTVTCTATDAAGNVASSTFVVTVQDTTPPVIASSPDLTVPASSISGAIVTYATPSVSDAVDPAPTVGCAPASGTPFPVGTTLVTCVATDASGNVATSSFSVTVTPFVQAAVSLGVELVPAATTVTAGTTRDLRIRALDSQGQVVTSFVGTVLLSASDGQTPLDGTLVSFAAGDQGERVLTGLAFFRVAGTTVIDAETLSAPILQGSLTLSVTPGSPALLTALAGAGDRTLITGEVPPVVTARVEDAFGNPNPGVSVRLVIGSEETLDATTGPDGQVSFSPSPLTTVGARACVLSTPTLSLAPTTFVWTVNAGVPPPGPSVLTVLGGGSDATIDEGERAPTLQLRVNSGSAAGPVKSGQVVTWTIRDAQGQLLGERRGISGNDGSVSITGPRLSALGTHTATVTVSNPQGAPLDFEVTVLARQHVSGVVLDASRDPGPALEGVVVRVRGTGLTTTTERDGSFRLEGVPQGPQVLQFDGPGSFAQVSQALVVSGTTALQRPLFLPRFEAPGVAVPLNAQNETTQAVTVPLSGQPLASLNVALGARVVFPSGASPEITAVQVELDELIWPLPNRATPATAVLFGPAGTQFPDGATLELPNDLGLPPGTAMEIFSADLATGAFTLVAPATVSPDATRVVSNGALISDFSCFVALPTASSTATTTLVGRVLDEDDTPLAGAVVSYRGVSTTTLEDDPLTAGVNEAGTFAIPGLPSQGPPATAVATRTNPNGYPESGRSLPAALVSGGQTDVGTFKISAKTAIAGRLVTDPGTGVAPTAGGRATVLARLTTTAADGTFVIPDVPSAAGPVKVFGYELTEPTLIKGFVVASDLVPHGQVDVGDVLLTPQLSSFSTRQTPRIALGTTRTSTPPLGRPIGLTQGLQAAHTCADTGRIYVAQGQQVLIWRTAPTTTQQPPDVVLGTGQLATGSPIGPTSIFADSDRLYVGDRGRVLVYEDPGSLETGDLADLALGQVDLDGTVPNRGTGLAAANTISSVGGLFSDGQRLYVLDRGNNRLLGWRTPPTTTGQPADFVIGQPSFTSTTSDFEGVTARTLCASPQGLGGDANRLYVADTSNHRVLVFSPLPEQTLTPATVVLGQSSFSSDAPGTLAMPTSIASDGQELVIAAGSGVFLWAQPPTANGAPPQQLGASLGEVNAVALSANRLYVAKTFRGVQVYSSTAAFAADEAPEVVLLSPGPGVTGGLDAGRSVVTSGLSTPLPGGGLLHQNESPLGASRWDLVVHNNQPADAVSGTSGIRTAFAAAGGRLYSLDALQPRIEARSLSGVDLDTAPEFTLPAPSTGTLAANADRLFLGNRFSPTLELFEPLPSAAAASTALNLDLGSAAPVSLRALAAGDAFLAVHAAGRVLLFRPQDLANTSAGTTPVGVLGQGGIAENVFYSGDADDLVHLGQGFNQEVASDGTRVYAVGANGRILVWETLPTTPGEPADAILSGQVVRVSADASGVYASLSTGGVGKWIPGTPPPTPSVASLETPVSPQTSGMIPLTFTLEDAQSDLCDVTLAYSIDDGLSFAPLTLASGSSTGLASSPQGTSHTLLWDSRADVPQRAGQVRIRVFVQDASGAGVGNHTYRFTVDNAPLSVAEVVTEVRDLALGVQRVEVSVDVTNRGLNATTLNPAALLFTDDQGTDLSAFFTVRAEGSVPTLVQPGGIERFRFRVDVSASAPLGGVNLGASVTGTEVGSGAPLGPELARVQGRWNLVAATATVSLVGGPLVEAFIGQDGPRTYTLQLAPPSSFVNLRIVSNASFAAGSPFLNVGDGSSFQLRGVSEGTSTLYVNSGTTTIGAFPLRVRAPANYLVSPAAVDFGTAPVGTPLTQTITIESQSGNLTVDQITVQPVGVFTLTGVPSLPAAVGSGASTSFTVRYDPQAGPSSAEVVITTQDALDPVTRVSLSGVGNDDAPTLLFTQPSEGFCSDGTGVVTLTYSDPDGLAPASLLVTLNGVDVTTSFTAGAGSATASLAALNPLEGSNTFVAAIQDSLGNQGSTTRTFLVDQTPPTLSLDPADGATITTTEVPITLTWSDVGCGVDPNSLSVQIDGMDRSGAFTSTANGAQATLTLSEGPHTLSVSVTDLIGLQASDTSTFTVALSASELRLTVVGADPAAVPVLSSFDLRLEALTTIGTVDADFSGEVQITTTPALAGLNGTVAQIESGVLTLPQGLRLTELGGFTLSAATTGASSIQGSLGVTGVLDRPGFVSLTPFMDAGGNVSLSGLSFPGFAVGIYVDDVLVQSPVANGTTGAFSAALVLAPNVPHDLQLRAIEPASQTERQSDVRTVLPAPASLSLTLTPEAQDLGLGELSQLQLTRVLSDGSSQDLTAQASYAVAPAGIASVDAEGLLTATGTGSATITATLGAELATAVVNVGPPIMISTSPAAGEAQVAVTRETIVRFSVPVSTASLTSGAVVATFAGQEIPGRLHLAADRRSLTLFYGRPLPPSSRVRIAVNGDLIETPGGTKIDVDRDGTPGGVAEFDFETLTLTATAGTSVCGRVFASELNGQINVPLQGVHITVDGVANVISATTDANGDFRLDPAPDGAFFVHIDGSTATNAAIPAGNYYPTVGKVFVGEPGLESKVGNVFLPLIQDGTLTNLNATGDTTITFPPGVEANNPELAGTQLIVPEGALFNDDGSSGGSVGIAPVPPDRLPGPLPPGLEPSFVITVQTDGATNFDQPVGVRFPNTDNLPPGTELGLWSFNHDTGQWETSGTMRVTADGLWIETDPGVGVRAPGWHTVVSGTSTSASRTRDPDEDDDETPCGEGADANEDKGDSSGGGGGSNPRRRDRKAKSTCKTDDSVILSNGEETLTRTDLAIPGRGEIHFELTRTYRSRIDHNGPMGHSWTFTYGERLYLEADGDVLRANGELNLKTWKRQPDGSLKSPPGVYRTLVRRPDGSFVSLEPNGFKRFYRSDGRVYCHEDRFGNRMLFDYDGSGNLSTVVDVYGREISFRYERIAGRSRLVLVEDFVGRQVRYAYDSLGDLRSVTTPSVTGTSIGNDFAEGRTERYEYLSGFTGPESDLNHNLHRVIAPQEVADNLDEAVLTLEYDQDSNSPFFDFCVAETVGGTRNVEGQPVAAGGRRSISYETLSLADLTAQGIPFVAGDPLTIPVARATLTEPNGLTQEYYVNSVQDHVLTRVLTNSGKNLPPLRPGEPLFYETRSFYNADHLPVRRIFPEGNEILYTYPTSGPRRARSNVLEIRQKAGPRGGGEDIVIRKTYEPLFNQIQKVVDPRGNATGFTPPLGAASAERYTTETFFDYQEHNDPVPLAEEFGIDLSAVPRGLGDLNGDGLVDQSFGNPIRIRCPDVLLRPGSFLAQNGPTQVVITETQWNHRGQITKAIDPEGNATVYNYYPESDPDGDGTRTWAPYVVLSEEETGYLRGVVFDAELTTRRDSTTPPQHLATSIRYDPVGNAVSMTNARGITTTVEYNQLDEPIVITRGADVSQAAQSGQLRSNEAPLQYKSRSRYDHNGRLLSTEIENRDSTTPGVGAYVGGTFEYDILGDLRVVSLEVDQIERIRSTFEYDASQLRTKITRDEGNFDTVEYDERNLAFRVTRGASDSTVASLSVHDYDLNGNRIRSTDAVDSDGDGSLEVSRSVYDGFDRPLRAIDPLGNYTEVEYDVASNMTRVRAFGHAAGSAPAPSTLNPDGTNPNAVLLSEAFAHYDELNRRYQGDARLFLSGGFAPLRPVDLRDGNSDGFVTSFMEFDRNSRVVFSTQDDNQTTSFSYDGLNRLVETVDQLGNRVQRTYDANSNVVELRSIELSPEGLIPSETFTTRMVYDQLDRLVRVTDNVGQTAYFSYDSRDNLVGMADAEGPGIPDPLGIFPGPINGKGNTKAYVYDGVSRRVQEICDLRVGGTGSGAIDVSNLFNGDGRVAVTTEFDGNSRVKSVTDDNGNTTTHTYDHLDRRTRTNLPDGTFHEYTYDRDSALRAYKDPNGTRVTRSFDALNRVRQIQVVSTATGVHGASTRTFAYDGLSRITAGTDDNGGSGTHTVERVYDSLSRMLEERQDGRVFSSVFTGDGNRIQATYPGGRQIASTFDALDRVKTVRDVGATGSPIVSLDYVGPGMRELRRTHRNGTRNTLLNAAQNAAEGYDGLKRIVRLRSTDSQGNAITDFEYAYSRANQRTFERRHHEGGLTDRYTYDSLYRLTQVDYDTDSGVAQRRDLTQSSFVLDGAGSRRSVQHSRTSAGSPVATTYSVDANNQYSSIQVGAQSPVTISNSDNGNLRADENNLYVFDDRNLLVEIRDRSTNFLVARYQYDAFHRRVLKQVFDRAQNLSMPVDLIRYFYDGSQCIEETDLSGLVKKTYVYGTWIDDVVQAELADVGDIDGDGNATETTQLYYHRNALGSVVAVTGPAQQVAERYRYTAYGETEVLRGDYSATAGNRTEVGQTFGFTGRRLDYEEGSGLYYYRNRFYDPAVGRFISRDPIGVWGDSAERGNGQNYAANNPINRVDPLGLSSGPEFWDGLKGGFGDGLGDFANLAEELFTVMLGGKDLPDIDWTDSELIANLLTGALLGLGEFAVGKFPPALAALIVGRIGIVLLEVWHCENFYEMLGYGIGKALAEILVGALGGKLLSKIAKPFKALRRKSKLNKAKGERARKQRERAARKEAERKKAEDQNQKPCGKDDPGCFLAGTLVLCEGGVKKIEDVKVGDRVLSRDEATGEQGYKRVVRLFRGHTDKVVYLRIAKAPATQRGRSERHRVGQEKGGSSSDGEEGSDPDSGSSQRIRCTTEHPFWVQGRGWVAAKDLKPGDQLLGSQGEQLVVVAQELLREKADHYNFEVEGWHTYFVSERENDPAVWNHNKCPPDDLLDENDRALREAGQHPDQPWNKAEADMANGPNRDYNRVGEYGHTPTKADRKALGAGDGEVVDHVPPLNQRWFEGDPSIGEPPGYTMTPAQRRASANDRSRMRVQSRAESDAQGGRESHLARERAKRFGR